MITLASPENETDSIITALQARVREVNSQYDLMVRISQQEIIRLRNDIDRLTLERNDLRRAFDAIVAPVHKQNVEKGIPNEQR